jgi:hypothetical protein
MTPSTQPPAYGSVFGRYQRNHEVAESAGKYNDCVT